MYKTQAQVGQIVVGDLFRRLKPADEHQHKIGQEMEHLKALGKASQQPQRPEDAELERVPNPHPDTNFVARFVQPEFTSLCPVTAQPDFAHLVIDYVPDQWMVESKSLKLYLNSFIEQNQSFL